MLWHRRETGGTRLQAMRSFMLPVSGPQAAVWASRRASGWVAADAVPLPCWPAKETTTVHSMCWDASVDHSRNAAKANPTISATSRPRLVIASCPGPPVQVSSPGTDATRFLFWGEYPL